MSDVITANPHTEVEITYEPGPSALRFHRSLARWGANIKLAGGTFTLTATFNKRDALTFIWDGTNWYEIARSQDM